MLNGLGQVKIWKMKKKLFPKSGNEPPSAKLNKLGELVTEKDALEDLYLETYSEIFSVRLLRSGNLKNGH